METVGDLCNSLGISIRQLEQETEPEEKICRHFEICSFATCDHRWPHQPSTEIGTCSDEVCVKMGVIASCINVSDARLAPC